MFGGNDTIYEWDLIRKFLIVIQWEILMCILYEIEGIQAEKMHEDNIGFLLCLDKDVARSLETLN
jgi:hypothetical protein